MPQNLWVCNLLMSCASTTRVDMAAIAQQVALLSGQLSLQWQSSCDAVVSMPAPAFRGNLNQGEKVSFTKKVYEVAIGSRAGDH